MLRDYQRAFLDFALNNGVIGFGEFTLKSGRTSPYFFNAGRFDSGQSLKTLGEFYADALQDNGIRCDCLFGPAYKGIPLVATTAMAMADRYGIDVPYVFNRKEPKDHGEGGQLVGAMLRGNVLIVDDVITAGTAIREVMTLLSGEDATVIGVLVAIDRMEKGAGELSAIQEVERDFGLSVTSVVNLDQIIEYLDETGDFQNEVKAIGAYRRKYGIAQSG